MSSADTFLGVFQALRFPFLAVDMKRLVWGLRNHPGQSSHIAISLGQAPAERREELIASLRAVFRAIEIPDPLLRLLSRSDSIQRAGLGESYLSMALNVGAFMIREQGDTLIWEEQSLWPLAYSTLFEQLQRILGLHQKLIEKRRADSPGVDTISEYPRQMPTQLHYAFASLGAWLGGAMNVQYFGYFATEPQIRDRAVNEGYAQHIGYDPDAAIALASSGLIAVPASLMGPLLEAQGKSQVLMLGSIPIDEINIANMPGRSFHAAAHDAPKIYGFLMDKHYRAAFIGRELGNEDALYGAGDVLRDHYADFYAGVKPASLVRCKHYCARVIDVASRSEIAEIIARVPIHDPEGVFFRGQPRLYTLNRDVRVRSLLFGKSCGVEPSLLTSAARQMDFSYDALHFGLKFFLGERILEGEEYESEKDAAWREMNASPLCEVDYAIMALAQHYGLPTHGLDVTKSVDVALWFAVNQFHKDAGGLASYRRLAREDWATDPADWPVIFVCQCVTHSVGQSLHDCHDLSAFGLEARRPIVQQARFFLGGHSDHQNRLAETVVCVLRLAPGKYETECDFAGLFPPPAEDTAYQAMLDFAKVPELASWGTAGVHRFHD